MTAFAVAGCSALSLRSAAISRAKDAGGAVRCSACLSALADVAVCSGAPFCVWERAVVLRDAPDLGDTDLAFPALFSSFGSSSGAMGGP